MTLASDVLTIERSGHVATLWLDRADRRNAMGVEFWADLPEAMAQLGDDPAIRVVVIAGRGDAFSVGLDLTAFAGLGGGAIGGTGETGSEVARRRGLLQQIKRMQWTMTSVAECPKPVIAAVHGWCLGGAIDLITACDIRLAAADAVFSVRETKIAMVADVGTLQRLPGVVAAGHLAELVYTGKDIDAERAHQIGLVNDVYADREGLHAAAHELAEEIAANSPLAVQGSKAVLRAGRDRSVAEALDYVAVWNAAFLTSNDLAEAMEAFVEKRPPDYRGE